MADQEIISGSITSAQSDVWQKIKKIAISDKVANAYIFSGPQGAGKEAIAIKFAQLLNCESIKQEFCGNCSSCKRCEKLEHENIKFIFPLPTSPKNKKDSFSSTSDKNLDFIKDAFAQKSVNLFHKIRIPKANRILIQSIREIRRSLYLKSDSNGKKVVIIFDAHLLSAGQGETANAFLKLLEEPPPQTTFILITDHLDLLLQTIISRCQRIGFPRLNDEYVRLWFKEKIVNTDDIDLLVALSRGNLQSAQFFVKQTVENLTAIISDLVHKTTEKDPENWQSFISEYSKIASQERSKFKYHFMLLKIWFKSTNLLKNNIDNPLQNTKLKNTMDKFLSKHPHSDLMKIVLELEKAEASISLNLYMPLVLVNLLINIQKILR